MGEHSGNNGWFCTGQDGCSMCVDIDRSSTKVYTTLSEAKDTYLSPLCCANLDIWYTHLHV